MENNDTDDVHDAVMECFKVLGQPLSVYSDDEGALNSKKLQVYFKGEGIEHIITKTYANQAERMIRTTKKIIADRLRANKDKTWVDMLKPSLNRYNTQVHSSTKMSPNKTHDHKNALEVKSNLVLTNNTIGNTQALGREIMLKFLIKAKATTLQEKKQKVNGLIENIK